MKNTLSQFYECVAALAEEKRKCSRSLEQYLRAMYLLISQEDRVMTYSVLFDIYKRSFYTEFCFFAEEWMNLTELPEITPKPINIKNIAIQTVAFLIADLRRMKEAGILSQSPTILYGGVDSPSGHRWYNFDPSNFIECGARGARDIVKDDSKNEINEISWDEVASIIDLGRIYE